MNHESEREPRLRALAKIAAAIHDEPSQPSFCAHEHWYGRGESRGLRGIVVSLVGWERADPVLGTQAAYDRADETIYDLLPDCRDCDCLAVTTWEKV